MLQSGESDTNSGPTPRFLPLEYQERPAEEMMERLNIFAADMLRRRTVRDFSSRPIPREIIEKCLRVAGTTPSGANMQPWHFTVVSNASIKREIRAGAEKEEREFYQHRASVEWLKGLRALGTDQNKPFLEEAPYLIIIFAQNYSVTSYGLSVKNYYVSESIGIATGMLITAIHLAGLVSLTHTPSPMGFLNKVLARPSNERPFLILAVGYPAEDATAPQLSKKNLEEIATFV
jgi:nitroreductase